LTTVPSKIAYRGLAKMMDDLEYRGRRFRSIQDFRIPVRESGVDLRLVFLAAPPLKELL
jgi:hypothetical protein